MSAEQGLTMTQFQPIHRYTPLSHTIFIYISFDIHIVNACHTLPILNSVNTRLFRRRYFIRSRRCSRPRTRTMNGLTRRFVRDVRRCIRLTRRRFIWIHHYPFPHIVSSRCLISRSISGVKVIGAVSALFIVKVTRCEP